MKRIISTLLVALMLLSCGSFMASAEESLSAELYVTIADKGNLTVTQKKVTVTDIDNDGALTINDALYAAHEAEFDGGAQAGYASAETAYGLSITKLWGDTSGNYGYCVNNASAFSLADPVKNGDYVYAYVYSDGIGFSDAYSFFNSNTVSAKAGDEIELTLSMASYDANWNPVTLPVSGAVITINGKETDITTNAEGKAIISLEEAGNYLIGAVSEDLVLVPPVCKAKVETAADDTSSDKTPQTGDASNTIVFAGLAVIAAFGSAVIIKKRNNEI